MAAEVAAGVWAAEEVVSTTAQVGFAAYMVAKPTMPLKATLTQIATSSDDSTRWSLVRSGHTLTCVGDRAYLFGGRTAHDKLASNEIHSVNLAANNEADYEVKPAIADMKDAPSPRTDHAACAFNVCVAIFGGCDKSGTVIDETSPWLYNTSKSSWERLDVRSHASAPLPRSHARLFNCQNNLLLYGGKSQAGECLSDLWLYDYTSNTWNQFPSAPTPVPASNAVFANATLHLIVGNDSMSSDLYLLQIDAKAESSTGWEKLSFPTNPLAPGPRPRSEAGFLPITTGYGRNYLLYFFGKRELQVSSTGTSEDTFEPTQWSDMWTFQIPSSKLEAKATTNISEAIKPARIKDAIRSKLGYDSGGLSWGEVEVLAPEGLPEANQGKVHPGPRCSFGCDVMEDGCTVVIWGGENAKGEREGDGWMIKLQ